MDRARYFEYIYRLPEANRNQLGYKEDVYDQQILLNEEWSAFAARQGREPEVAAEEHVKWITETWEECLNRKRAQKEFLDESDKKSDVQQRLSNLEKKKRQEKSSYVVSHLLKYQDEIDKTRTPCRHNLYLNFQALQQERFRREREMIESEEFFIRTKIELWEDSQTFLLNCAMQWNYAIHDLVLREREAKEEAERHRIEEEKKRAEEERLRLEEQRKRDEEEAEKLRREQAEIDKRLERKRKEEVRRAKMKADRQKQQYADEQAGESPEKTQEPNPEPQPKPEPEPEPVVEPETVLALEEPMKDEEPPKRCITFTDLEGDNIVSLMNSATTILHSGGDHSYIMSVRKKPDSSTVICQNGIFSLEENENSPLLGKKLSEACVSICSTALHNNVSDDLDEFLQMNVEHIVNVKDDGRCFPFRSEIEKNDETLVLFPVSIPNSIHSPFVVALCRDGCDSISFDEITQTGKLVFELGKRLRDIYLRMYTNQLCQQCVDWLSLCMGCDNVYISLRPEASDDLIYVAATPSHKFLLGMHHTRADENEGHGVSLQAMDLSIPEKRCVVTNFPDVSKPSDGLLKTENIRFFQDSQKKGPLMLAPITGCRDDEGVSLGCVFIDRIGSKTKFSSAEEEVMRTATQMLADVMLGNIPLETAVHLKIEEDVDPSSLTFLKILWDKCLQNLGNITSNQLLELAKYLHPPPVIPKVVQSSLLVALRCKPSKISEWDSARKKVNQKLLAKMGKCDPTNVAVTKNSFFVRARKLVKGLTAEEVFEKGSFPTQCFFNWVFAAILLRRHTMALRKKIKLEGMVFDDNISIGSLDTAETNLSDEDTEIGDDAEGDNDNNEDSDDDIVEENEM